MTPLLPLAEAQRRLLATVEPLPLVDLTVEQAAGHWLAEPLTAMRMQPAAPLSAMDGYAVVAGDLHGPWRVVGESSAGHPWTGSLGAGEAVRIATGAVLPRDAGAVIVQEDCRREGPLLTLTGRGPVPADKHIRKTGFDFNVATPLLERGTHLGPAQIALTIAGGHGTLKVHRRPKIAIIDSGDELSPPGTPCQPHQIPASNGAMLAALLACGAAQVIRIGPVHDDLDALLTALGQAAEADLIVTSGGASVGDHDLIRPALEQWGARLDFWRVAMRPGKPVLHATRGDTHLLGLPGNPTSSLVCAWLFALPMLRAMAGAAQPLPRTIEAPVGADLAAGGARQEFLRGWWDGRVVTPNPMRDSSALAALAASNCLIDRPIDALPAKAGEFVPIHVLNWQ
ncbi:MAG: molybdopterin molybdotransferase MoeA [Sphingomonadales bacterium]|nr:molybdopterin molybdotransferase MoeA [Sphingomonadales bacterium]MDE2169972.1 molybdopterin molybdotransferase MoeA [Sphingomonadales bacterium]